MSEVLFVDVETTGLDPDRHEIWEVALILDEYEIAYRVPVDLTKADAGALRINRFYERVAAGADHTDSYLVAKEVATLTANRHLAGAVPSFDAQFLSQFLHKHGFQAAWHYHLIDVEALAIGYLHGYEHGRDDSLPVQISLPWDSEVLSRAVGVDPEQFDRHTALGDARWAKALYEKVTG